MSIEYESYKNAFNFKKYDNEKEASQKPDFFSMDETNPKWQQFIKKSNGYKSYMYKLNHIFFCSAKFVT